MKNAGLAKTAVKSAVKPRKVQALSHSQRSLAPKKGMSNWTSQSVEKPEIQENWISGFTCFIIKVAKHENVEE